MSYRIICLFILTLSGCIWNIDKPPPPWWSGYSVNGASEAVIRAALLECGSNIPGETIEFYAPDGNGFLLPRPGLNAITLVQRCMQNAGFPHDQIICTRWKELPACQADAVIPKRSIENRINSLYCKTYPKAALCQPDYDPSKDDATPAKNQNSIPKSISVAPSIDPATKLQNQIQKDGNAQMNQLLQSSGTRK